MAVCIYLAFERRDVAVPLHTWFVTLLGAVLIPYSGLIS